MKPKLILPTSCLLCIFFLAPSCSKKLIEKPYTVFTIEYFKTPIGLQAAVNTVYSGMRYNYGPNGALAVANVGTDEWTYGDQPRTGQDNGVLEMGTYSISSANGNILTPWNRNYSNINLCNGILQFAPEVAIDDISRNTIIAEARYLRAHYYMLLVTQFGAVPLDLGSGDLQFNSSPFTGFNRLPVNELLVKNYDAMIEDLIYATQNLPDKRPENAFKLAKAAAYHLLSKVYLFRAYSAVSQPNDFKNAWDAAMQVINNKALYNVELLADYGNIHKQGFDYNKEILYSVERLPLDNNSNEVSAPGSDFANKVNIANNMFNPDYTGVNVPANSNYKPCGSGGPSSNGRTLAYGRPLRRYAPTAWLLNVAFADRYNDSRFDNSFRMMWRATPDNTLPSSPTGNPVLIPGNDTAFLLTHTNAQADSINALGGHLKKRWRAIAPREFYSNQNTAQNIYPNLKKYDDSLRAAPNDVSGRPFIVAKLSEVYLLAAEAALGDGRPGDAATLINVLRHRAAYRPSRPGLTPAENDAANVAAVAAMTINSGDINLDFILDERTRELCGESLRWPDLAMRGKLVERVQNFNPDGAANIRATHVLRPIPQTQLDAISDPNKAQYQNPGY